MFSKNNYTVVLPVVCGIIPTEGKKRKGNHDSYSHSPKRKSSLYKWLWFTRLIRLTRVLTRLTGTHSKAKRYKGDWEKMIIIHYHFRSFPSMTKYIGTRSCFCHRALKMKYLAEKLGDDVFLSPPPLYSDLSGAPTDEVYFYSNFGA